jgi:Fe2+ or Zn2+ uptake regulation protein
MIDEIFLSKGIHPTRMRKRILQHIIDSNGTLSAEDICNAMEADGATVAEIQENISKMAEKKVLRTVSDGKRIGFYMAFPNNKMNA